MKTIGVHSYKGGVAKSTTSLSICGGLVELGYKVALIDLDPQGSAAFMLNEVEGSHYPFDIYEDTVGALDADLEEWKGILDNLRATSIDFLVCDYPPGIPGAKIVHRHDLVLVPFRPCMPDYEAAQRGMTSLHEHDVALPVLTQFDASSPDHKVFAETVREDFGDIPIIPRRAIFERANNQGQTIYTMKSSLYGVRQARQVINSLVEKVLDQLR